MYKLVIEDDEGNSTVVPIVRDEISIGRQDGNTIRLTERNVSRKHAKLVRSNGEVTIEDIASRYGTKFNGETLGNSRAFREGDVVLIGDYRLSLQQDRTAAEPKPDKGGVTAVAIPALDVPDEAPAPVPAAAPAPRPS